jgi:hypothetical protein
MARRRTRSRKSRRSSVRVTGPASSIKSFTSTGRAAPGTLGSFSPTPLGHFDTTTGRVYQHPRLKADPIAASGSVRVTNPDFSGPGGHKRTRGLGMGAVNAQVQTGRNVGIKGGAGD